MTTSRNTLTADLRAMPRAFWVLVAGVFVNRFGSFVYPFLTVFLSGRNFSLGAIGAIIAGYGAGSALATVAGGWTSDRFGRRNTIVAGTLANAAFVFALYFASSTPMLAMLTMLAGFSGGFYQPASSALVADLVPEERRLAAYAVMRQSANAGFAFGTAAAGFLITHSTFWLFAGDALTTAAFGVIALFMLPHGLRATSTQARWGEALAHIRRDSRFWALFAAQALTALVFTQFASSYALEVTGRQLQIGSLRPEQIYGLLIGWNGVMVVLLELPLTRFTQRFDPRRAMCWGYVMIGFGFALNAFAQGFWGLFTAMTIFTLGEIFAMPMLAAWVAHLAPEHMRGRYIGALSSAWSFAGMLGPALGLQVFGFSPTALWLGCGALGGLAAFILARWGDDRPHSAVAPRAPAVLDAAK
ncbi:MAG: MFS transporter [Chthoniobacteraceae bacterium]